MPLARRASNYTYVEASWTQSQYATRETRRIDVAPRTAKHLPIKTLESFDFSFQPSFDRERTAALAQLDVIRRAEVVHFVGPPGTGTSNLTTALGGAAVRAGKQVYRAAPADLIEALTKAERQSESGHSDATENDPCRAGDTLMGFQVRGRSMYFARLSGSIPLAVLTRRRSRLPTVGPGGYSNGGNDALGQVHFSAMTGVLRR